MKQIPFWHIRNKVVIQQVHAQSGKKQERPWVCLLSLYFFFFFFNMTWRPWWKFGYLMGVAVLSELTILKQQHIILKPSGESYHIHIHSTGSLLFYLGHLFSDFLQKVIVGVLLDCSCNNICAPPQSSLRGETAHHIHCILNTFPAAILLTGKNPFSHFLVCYYK